MKSSLNLYIILGIFFFPFVSIAQHTENRCANLQVPEYFAKSEAILQQAIAEKMQKKSTSQTLGTEETYVIPIIFHIMHQNEKVGEGNNISYEQILSQVTVLNEDYNRTNADASQTLTNFRSVAASANIRFELAKLDPQGAALAEAGVERLPINKKIWDLNEFNQQIAPRTIWNPNHYLNVWVIDSLTVGGSGFVGYAQFPEISATDLAGLPSSLFLPTATANTDGVVMDHNNLGAYRIAKTTQLARARLNQGRTLTHEIGHFLGVRHIFSDNRSCEDDFCNDTPIQGSPTSITTPCEIVLGRQTCGNLAMVQNFMDYSNDICMNIFTKDQVARMRTVLEKSPRRKELLTSPVLLSANDEALSRSVIVYPNPTTDKIYIEHKGILQLKSYVLYNTLGQIVLQNSLSNANNEISVADLAKGLYILHITAESGKVVKKLLVE
jgi:zinc-dependent metalloproteinase lipoprotein